MPGRRCVVQGCNNTPNLDLGISVHISPKNKSARDKWARFVRTHRANFNPRGRFMVCSDHFAQECFERSLHVESSQRTPRPGSVPSIWMNKNSQESSTSRSVRTRKKLVTSVWHGLRGWSLLLKFSKNENGVQEKFKDFQEPGMNSRDFGGLLKPVKCTPKIQYGFQDAVYEPC